MSWNAVSTSCGDADPLTPSESEPTEAETRTALPASFFVNAVWSNSPTPDWLTTPRANDTFRYRSSDMIDVPPGLVAEKRISSSLKSVGLRTTRTPFSSVHIVTPTSSRTSSLATGMPSGATGRSGASAASSS